MRNIRNDKSYDGRIYPYEHTPIHSKSIKKLWMRDSARSSAKGILELESPHNYSSAKAMVA